MLKNLTDLSSSGFPKGLSTNANILALTKEQTPNAMDVMIDHDLSIVKRYGTTTLNAVAIALSGAAGFSPDSNNLLKSNIIAYWKMDEDGGNRSDSISTHTLQDNNSVGQAVGIKRFAASFVAANSEYLLHENTATLATGDTNFGISAWINPSSISSTVQQTIISKRGLNSIDSFTKLLLHMDGGDASTTFTDSSPNPKTVTPAASAQIDTAQSKFGGASGLFSGGDDKLTIPHDSDFDFGTDDCTIDFWVRFNAKNASDDLFRDVNSNIRITADHNNNEIAVLVDAGNVIVHQTSWTASTATWYHIAWARSGTSSRIFIDGTQFGATVANSTNIQVDSDILIGNNVTNVNGLEGWIDELRVSKGVARWTANFTPFTGAYGTIDAEISNYEYFLFINTDQIVTFRVSSSGTSYNGTVQATSFGAITTGTWYNVVAWHDTANILGLSVNLSVNTASYSSGLRSGSAPFVIGAISNGISNFFDGNIDEVGFWKRALTATDRTNLFNAGSGNTYNLSFGSDPWASFDFGASNIRWLTVAAGTGIYTSSNMGITWVNIASDRTATYQAFERSKASLIATSDAYDVPLQWAGSAGTFATIMNTSAPLAKFSVNFKGFLILLNSNTRKRGFYYEDENSQLTGDWGDSFDIPSSADDEITGSFVLRKNLYVSTRYTLFRLTYVGGNPDWRYDKVKDFGYVARTVRIVSLKDIGEVAIGMDYGRHIRLFDGSDDKIVSTEVEHDNMMCDFAMDKISYALSGLTISHSAVNDDDVYKLCVAIGASSTQTTHTLNFDGRTSAFYPYSNTPFNTMVMAESANRRHLLAFDRSGYCHMVDSGNLDAGITPINEVFDSPFLFEKSPSALSKSQQIHLYFTPASAGTVHILDRVDFSSSFTHRDHFALTNDGTKVQIKKFIDIPQTANVYQYRITSSASTSDPWTLNRIDYFLKGLGIGDSE